MRWYSAAIAFRTGAEDDLAISISLVALRAPSVDTADARATELGEQLAKDYKWQLEDVIDVYEITEDALDEGAELYSFFVTHPLLDVIRSQVARNRQ